MMRSPLARITGRQGGLTVLALAAVLGGVVMLLIAVHGQQAAPPVPASAAGTVHPRDTLDPTSQGGPAPTAKAAPTAGGARPDRLLEPSEPVTLSIPSIGVHTKIVALGKAEDGTLAVPQPGPNLNKAAWFKNSPTPGQPGPAIIEGHVDTEEGPSVFFRLGDLRPGDNIHVTRRDRTTVVFTVSAVRDYKKSAFPTSLVYGGQDLATSQLRLITCSDFDPSVGHHLGNAVVFAHLTGHSAP
jgi:sortase (surface protein transpeptidase)